MHNAILALGVLSAAIHPALAQSPDVPATVEDDRLPAEAVRVKGPKMAAAQLPPPGPREGMRLGPDGRRDFRAGPRPAGLSPELALAGRLAALEARIGIRADQLDAWRDYTNALQTLIPPLPGRGPARPGESMSGTEPDGGSDPFAHDARLADDVVARAAAATKLKVAIATLRTTLTLEQLEILASASRPLRPPLGHEDVPPEGAIGPGAAPGEKRSPQHDPRREEPL